jgi:histidine triad (HIT) family protein
MGASNDQNNPDHCLICKKHRGEISAPGGIIYEDNHVMVFHASIPEGASSIYLGYLMIELKRHAPGLADMTDAEAQSVGIAMARVSKALQNCEPVEHVYSFVLGHHVPHLHIQIVPRYMRTPREYWGPKVTSWPDAPVGGHDQITALADRLRHYLQHDK